MWQRIKDFFGRLFRREAPPGEFVEGRTFALRGWLDAARWIAPARHYLLYLPSGYTRWSIRRRVLLVLCHGCRQTPEDIAAGARIAALADRLGALVLLPRQSATANPWRCWNWFDGATVRGSGEASIVAAMIEEVCRWRFIQRERVLVAGISAGGALAAIMGLRYPGLVRAVVVHSGLACGAAVSALTALAVMRAGPEADVEAIAREARSRSGPDAPRVPLLAIHGLADNTVAPVNAEALVRQYLAFNATAPAGGDAPAPLPPSAEASDNNGGRNVRTRDWLLNGRLIARLVEVDGLGHAWSGGDAALAFNDSAPPDSTALLAQWLAEAAA